MHKGNITINLDDSLPCLCATQIQQCNNWYELIASRYEVNSHVYPLEIDFWGHMNNARSCSTVRNSNSHT